MSDPHIAHVHSARLDDGPAIEALLNSCGLPVDGVGHLLATTPEWVLVARDAHHAIVAVAGIEPAGSDGLLRSVAVREDWRAHGLARELVQRLIGQAEARGLSALYLLTTTAEQYFPRFGFAPIARALVPSSVAGTIEFTSACPATAVVMQRPVRPLSERAAP